MPMRCVSKLNLMASDIGSSHIDTESFYRFRKFYLLQHLIYFSLKRNILPLLVGQVKKGILTLNENTEVNEFDEEQYCMHWNCKIFGCGFYLFPGVNILRSQCHTQRCLKYSAEEGV
jgi:hypothetical protein